MNNAGTVLNSYSIACNCMLFILISIIILIKCYFFYFCCYNNDMSMEKNLENLYPFLMERTIRTLKHQQLISLKKNNIDLTIEQWVVLLGIKNYAGATQKEISDKTFKDTANVKRMTDLLIKKGYAKRMEHNTDTRKSQLTLTQNGEKIISKALPVMDKVRQKALTDVTQKEFDYLVSTLKKMYHNLI